MFTINTTPDPEVILDLPEVRRSAWYDCWACGPRAIARVLQYHGTDVSYDNAKQRIVWNGLLRGVLHFDTSSTTLRNAMQYWRPDTVEEWLLLGYILHQVRNHNPVIALINKGNQAGGYPLTHWVIVGGYHAGQGRVYLYNHRDRDDWDSVTFEAFKQMWKWDHRRRWSRKVRWPYKNILRSQGVHQMRCVF